MLIDWILAWLPLLGLLPTISMYLLSNLQLDLLTSMLFMYFFKQTTTAKTNDLLKNVCSVDKAIQLRKVDLYQL